MRLRLAFSIGDRGLRWPSQDLTDPAGSMIRLAEDGGAAQGIAVHPQTGEIWTTEHGPNGGDLLHRIEAGANYGWPQMAFGTEYDTDEKIGIGESAPGVQTPVHVWTDTMAPSGLAFYTGGALPQWDGHLFAGSLYRKQLHRLVLDDGRVTHEEVLLTDAIGRIRDVRQGPDGHLYLLTDESEGGLYRLEPAG